MKSKRYICSNLCEAAVVLLITAVAFQWGRATALTERGYAAVGGEYLLLLLPPIYYAGKQTILDWGAVIKRKLRERGKTQEKKSRL